MAMSSEESKFYEVLVNISKSLSRIANIMEKSSTIQNKSTEQMMKESKFRMRTQRNIINESKRPLIKTNLDNEIEKDVKEILESKTNLLKDANGKE